MKTERGFTLLELMIALAVAAIIMTIGIPSFSTLIKNSRQTAQINNLLNAMVLARSEAVKLNQPVTVCQSSNGTGCTNTGWNDGWIVFRDDGVPGTVDGTDTVVQKFAKLSSQTSLGSETFPLFLTFNGDGTSNAGGSFSMCDDRGAAHAISLCVTATGRLYTSNSDCNGGAVKCP